MGFHTRRSGVRFGGNSYRLSTENAGGQAIGVREMHRQLMKVGVNYAGRLTACKFISLKTKRFQDQILADMQKPVIQRAFYTFVGIPPLLDGFLWHEGAPVVLEAIVINI